MPATLVETALRARNSLDAQEKDPLAWWRFGVPRLREAFLLLAQDIDELHARGPNKSGKTLSCAAYVLACAQKRQTLDGVEIPQWRGPVECVQLVRDYKVQLLSVQPAYERLLGKWPHHATWNGPYLESLLVMPQGGDPRDRAGWSPIYFISQKNQQSGIGYRADVVAFDEPPIMKFLRELRKAAHAGRRGIILIGETPEHRIEWAPLLEDYGDSPRRSITRVDRLRAEVRWSLDEVEDWVLSRQEKRDLWDKYKGDPLFGEDGGARWHGDYLNVSGSCAWGKEGLRTLIEMLATVTEPTIEQVRAIREDANGEPTEVARVPVQVWRRPETGKRYYLDIDPASGVDDGKHNPAGLLVVERGSANLCARWNGYLAPFTLGTLAAALGRQYNMAGVDIEMKDHWGVNVHRGLVYSKYGNILHETRELRPGDPPGKEAGWDMDKEARAIIIGCIREWLDAWRVGIKYAACPSRDMLDCFISMELDDRGQIVAGPGIAHAEDAVLWGRALQKCASRASKPLPEVESPIQTPEQRVMAEVLGIGRNGTGNGAPMGGIPRLRIRR